MLQLPFVPAKHQTLAFEMGKDLPAYGFLYSMGLGKSASALINAVYLYGLGRINTLIIIAPNGVQRKWLTADVKFAVPDYVDKRLALWKSGSAKHIAQCEKLLYERGNHLRIFAANTEALVSPKFRAFLLMFVQTHVCMMAVDESQSLKSPTSLRSKELCALRHHIPYRRILSGTSATQSPLDLFGQFRFLDPHILGDSFTMFKAEYAQLVSPSSPLIQKILRDNPRIRGIPQIVMTDALGRPMYKNLDRLREKISPYCCIARKEDVGTDFPEKVYVEHRFEMSPEQSRIYKELKKELILTFNDELVTVTHKMILAMRLQQISQGFITLDGKTGIKQLFERPADNPRIKTLLEALDNIDEAEQVLIFCRFRPDSENLRAVIPDALLYHGGIDPETREKNYHTFQSGGARIMLSTIGAGHRGLDFPNVTTTIFFSNAWSADQRAQAEDRTHRITSTGNHRLYIDLIADNTIDEHILLALRSRVEVEKYLMRSSEWLLETAPTVLMTEHVMNMV